MHMISRPKRAKWFEVVSLVVAAGICILSASTLVQLRSDTWARAHDATMNVNRALGQDIGSTITIIDLALRATIEALRHDDVTVLEGTLRSPLFDNSALAGRLGNVMVMDAAGQVLKETDTRQLRTVSLADRDYFIVHRDDPDLGLYVSQPFRGRISGEWLVAFSRRWTRPDGSFGGAVVATLQLAYFQRIFANLSLGAGSRITLFRNDGIALIRMPFDATIIGQDFTQGTAFRAMPGSAEGSYRSVSARDRIERFYTFRRIENLPLILNVGQSIEEIEAPWRRRALAIGGMTLALVVALLITTWLLRRELDRRQLAEQALRDSEANFRLLAENTSDMVSRIGPDGIRTYVSPAARRILGRAPADLVGRSSRESIHADDLPQIAAAVARLRAREADEVTVTYRTWRADGAEIWLESTVRSVLEHDGGTPDGVVAVSRDVTERKNLERQLSTLARLDGLTGVANRRVFDEAMGREWLRCMQARVPLSVIMVDVDRFKAFNDHYGHQGGDACLRVVAATVGATIRRASDLVARYGGEEFAVLLPDTDAAGAAAVAERLRQEVEALQLAHAAAGPDGAVVTVSVGVATMVPASCLASRGPNHLIEAADRALYAAKQEGRNCVRRAAGMDPLVVHAA